MLIGILQCGHALPTLLNSMGDYDAMFAKLLQGHGLSFQTWNVVDMEFPPTKNAADGWILTGSKHGVYDDLPFIAPLEDLIRSIYKNGGPMVGICFGHQIIAQALGGKVAKFEGGWAVGHQSYTFEGKGQTDLNAWHQDQVLTAPSDARVFASNDFCRFAGLVYGDKAWTIQPHPEFNGDVISELVDNRRGTADYPDNLMDIAKAKTTDPVAAKAIADDMAAFLKAGLNELA